MNLEISDEDLIRLMGELSADGVVAIEVPDRSSSFSGYVSDLRQSWWMYLLLGMALAETLLVEYNARDGLLALSRLILGLLLLGLIPGYSALKLIFPAEVFSFLERTVLSVFLSILISILTGTLLGAMSSLGSTSTVLVLTVSAFVLTIAAGYRIFSAQTRSQVLKAA